LSKRQATGTERGHCRKARQRDSQRGAGEHIESRAKTNAVKHQMLPIGHGLSGT
jgi:hypothetical protein